MVHFPELEPNTEEMQEPNALSILDRMEDQVIQSIQNLTEANFSVKIIDFGVANRIDDLHTPASQQYEGGCIKNNAAQRDIE